MSAQVTPRIACIGECMIEMLLPDANGVGGVTGFAGDTFNAAVYLKRAAPEIQVSYVTALGTDAASSRMIEAFQARGLDTSLVERRSDRLPGCYAITVSPEGERSFLYWRSASAARTLFQTPASVTLDRLDSFDLIYLSGITVAILDPKVRAELADYLAAFRARGGQVAFDSNYRPALWPDQATAQEVITRFWSLCSIALPSVDDEMALFGDADGSAVINRLRGLGVETGALKCGSAGPLPLERDVARPAFAPSSTVVDTTAAGDSFNGAYLAALLRGADPVECLQAGHDMANRVIAYRGAILPE